MKSESILKSLRLDFVENRTMKFRVYLKVFGIIKRQLLSRDLHKITLKATWKLELTLIISNHTRVIPAQLFLVVGHRPWQL